MLDVFGAGRDHGIRKTEVFVENGIVHSIDVTFDSLEEEQFLDAMYDKYGRKGWKAERDPGMVITDLEDKSSIKMDRLTLTKKAHD